MSNARDAIGNRFETRAVEIHDFTYIWNLSELRRRLDFMAEYGMNALVLHEPGITDKIVFPAKFLGGDSKRELIFEVYKQIDKNIYHHALRENLNLYRRDYLKQLIREAAQRGIDVYLEDKELWFKDLILKYKPELMRNGVLCPSNPFWWEEYLPEKYQELFVALPELTGVVTSFGTGESRLAIANMHACDCENCANLDPKEWHKNMTLGMYGPFNAAGRKLVVRDFIYTKEEQEQFGAALNEVPQDIAISLKNTPHDFYPTFPDNPLIGNLGGREQWIEYDVHGQYFGYGIAPCAMLDDVRSRLDYAAGKGVSGFIMRTDWEGVQDISCFDTPNLVNLMAAALLGKSEGVDDAEIYEEWLSHSGMLREGLTQSQREECVDRIAGIFDRTWPILEKTVYVNGTVFSDNSSFHVSLEQPTWVAETHHSLKNWDATAEDALGLSDDNVVSMLREKDEAAEEFAAIYRKLLERNPGLTPEAYDRLVEHFEFSKAYVEGFRLLTRTYVFARLVLERNGEEVAGLERPSEELYARSLADLEDYAGRLKSSPQLLSYPGSILINPERLASFIRDVKDQMEARKATAPR